MKSKMLNRFATATAIAVLALSVPVTSGISLTGVALAKDHGGGNGGGNGGGHGNGGGNQGSGKSDHAGKAQASDDGVDNPDDSDDQDSSSKQNDQDHGASKGSGQKLRGVLNAAHASPTALAHAAPNSAVGKIAAYERERKAAMSLADSAERDEALADAVRDLQKSFGRTFTKAQIAKINALLDRD